MLKHLLGCKSVERILLYLLVNECCYPHQLHRLFETPLTPIQKAFKRLEEGGVVTSSYEGKMRLYRFNAGYPLLSELEMLLKRAFQQLSPQEKKSYFMKKSKERPKQELLELVWAHLKNVSRVKLVAKSLSKQSPRWHRKGEGKVVVKEEGLFLIFYEQGSWREEKGRRSTIPTASAGP